jgi:AraC-like DNA-binding protein
MSKHGETFDLPSGGIRAITVVVPPSPVSLEQEHLFHELLLPLSSPYRVFRHEGPDEVQPGQVLLLPSGTWHRTEVRKEALHLLVVQWRDLDLAPWPLPHAGIHPDTHGRLLSHTHWLMTLNTQQDERTQDMRRHLLWLMLAELNSATVEPTTVKTDEDLATAALQHMAYTHEHPWSLSELARHYGVSASRLGQLIRRRTGQSMSDHLRQARLEHALNLIRQTRLPLQTIATKVGYRSAFHVSTAITRYCGRSPRELRRR